MTDIDGPKQYNQFKFHNLSSQAVPLTYNKYFIRSKYLGCSPSSQHCSQIKIHNIYPPQALPPIISQRCLCRTFKQMMFSSFWYFILVTFLVLTQVVLCSLYWGCMGLQVDMSYSQLAQLFLVYGVLLDYFDGILFYETFTQVLHSKIC